MKSIKNYITNLQGLPKKKKKIIFWSIMSVLILFMLAFAVQFTSSNIAQYRGSANNINPVDFKIDFSENQPINPNSFEGFPNTP